MHVSVLDFFEKEIPKEMFKGDIIEVGSLVINGSVRDIVMANNPKSYIGIDFIDGDGVDKLVNAEYLVEEFGENSFDTVISTEMLEHAVNWQRCVNQMKLICRKYLIVTTRSPGFGYHEYPTDEWRFSMADMEKIYSDYHIHKLVQDPQVDGVFMIAEKLGKPLADISHIELVKPVRPDGYTRPIPGTE